METKQNQISIIIPVYNVEKYIARAIESCINQSFKNLEIIIVDDCGSDRSIEIATTFAKADPRIKIIHNPKNLKLLRTRLEGAKVATSDYIMFLDSDDYLDLDICKKVAQALEESKNLDLLCFEMLIKSDQGLFKEALDYEAKYDSPILSRRDYLELMLQSEQCNWNLCGKVFKREVYLKTLKDLDPALSVNMAEDALIYFSMLFHLSYVFILKQEGYFYCKNNGSLTQTNDLEKRAIGLYETQEVINFISQKLPMIYDEAFQRFAKIMLRDLKFHHQCRKNLFFYLKNKGVISYCIMRGRNLFASLAYEICKKTK